MPNLAKIAALLDAKKLLLPICKSAGDNRENVTTSFASFAELIKSILSENTEIVSMCLEELSKATNPKLWEVFARNGGELTFYNAEEARTGWHTKESKSEYDSKIIRDSKTGEKQLKPFIAYCGVTDFEDQEKHTLFHELGHYIDDQTYYKGMDYSTQNVLISRMGFHSSGKIWDWLVELDKKNYPNGGAIQIEADRTYGGYARSNERYEGQWNAEVFAAAVNHHMGPHRKKAPYAPGQHRFSSGQKAVLSPFLNAYMNQIVNLDIAIQAQPKSYAERQQDRAILLEELHKPLEECLDIPALEAQQALVSSARGKAKERALKNMEQLVTKQLYQFTKNIADQIGINWPAPGKAKN